MSQVNTPPNGVPVVVVSLLAPIVQSVIKAAINAAAGVGIAVSYEDQAKLQAALIFVVSVLISVAWTWVERKVFARSVSVKVGEGLGTPVSIQTQIKPNPIVMLALALGLGALVVLAGCATNSQRVKGGQLELHGAPAGMNSLNVTGNDYGVVSRNPIGVVDGQGMSVAGENPMTVVQLILADGQTVHLASGSNGKIERITIEDLKTGVTSQIEGVDWDNEKVNNSTAATALALYAAMKDFSKDEAAVRLKQIEVTGEVAGNAIGLARTLLGVP